MTDAAYRNAVIKVSATYGRKNEPHPLPDAERPILLWRAAQMAYGEDPAPVLAAAAHLPEARIRAGCLTCVGPVGEGPGLDSLCDLCNDEQAHEDHLHDLPTGTEKRMSKTITLTLTVPDGVDVDVRTADVDASDVEAYWDYLSDNGQKLYAAAARIELRDGPGFTLETVASEMGVKYATAQSIHRTTGRTARRWNDDTGTEAPIRLVDTEYAWSEEHQGMRTAYRLPEGVAQELGELDGDGE